MSAPVITMKINTVEFNRWLNGVARQQIPFATAQALTMTAKDAQRDLKAEAGRTMTLRNAHTARGIRIKRAEKRDGFGAMNAQVGSIDWYVAGQADDASSVRTPQTSRYRYIPVKARPNQGRRIPKRFTPAALAQIGTAFWKHQANGTALVYQRTGKHGLRLMYVAVPRQTIKPKLSLIHVVTMTANRTLRKNFIRSMQKAIKAAR